MKWVVQTNSVVEHKRGINKGWRRLKEENVMLFMESMFYNPQGIIHY